MAHLSLCLFCAQADDREAETLGNSILSAARLPTYLEMRVLCADCGP
jgi:hypothetical protein